MSGETSVMPYDESIRHVLFQSWSFPHTWVQMSLRSPGSGLNFRSGRASFACDSPSVSGRKFRTDTDASALVPSMSIATAIWKPSMRDQYGMSLSAGRFIISHIETCVFQW